LNPPFLRAHPAKKQATIKFHSTFHMAYHQEKVTVSQVKLPRPWSSIMIDGLQMTSSWIMPSLSPTNLSNQEDVIKFHKWQKKGQLLSSFFSSSVLGFQTAASKLCLKILNKRRICCLQVGVSELVWESDSVRHMPRPRSRGSSRME
jgi:hypothetical protein